MVEVCKVAHEEAAQVAEPIEVTDEGLEAAAVMAASAQVTSMWGHC